MTALHRDGIDFSIVDRGEGLALVFQHGLGGDAAQVAQNVADSPGWRRLTVECRGQGATPAGSTRPFSFELFAGDVLAAADAVGIDRFVAGGISMGAGIALRLAALYPDRVSGLVLVRPAWTFSAAPRNMQPFAELAALIASHPLDAARAAFAASVTAERLGREAPDNLASLMGFFDRPDARVFAEVMGDIAVDGPGVVEAEAAALKLPVLVIGNERDAVHPLPTARVLAATIPGARFVEVAAKAADKDRHFAEIRAAIAAFLAPFQDRSVS